MIGIHIIEKIIYSFISLYLILQHLNNNKSKDDRNV